MFRHRACFVLLLLAAGGCGYLSSSTERDEPKPEKTYGGLTGQVCAVMVWADWRTRVDYTRIQGDLAALLQQRLEGQKKDAKSSPSTTFLNPLSVVRYQREHPEIEALPIAEVAPKLSVTRLIYVELGSFSVQSPDSIMILKGSAEATLRVLEISGQKASVAFEESGIKASYPPDAPEGVVPSDKYNLNSVYKGTIEELADRLAARFSR